MVRSAAKALVLPFDRQNLDYPSSEKPWLFLNAHRLDNPALWVDGLVCEQGFRPEFKILERAGWQVKPEQQEDQSFAGALVLTSRYKDLNKQMVVRAARAVAPNAPVFVAGEKTSGIASLKKWASKYSPIVETFSKFHAQLFRIDGADFTKRAEDVGIDNPAVGTFGTGKIDKGSQLLTSTFDKTIEGQVADFAAGTGYLTRQLIEGAAPDSIDLYEAEYRSLQLARRNLSAETETKDFHWHDLTQEPVPARYDWIVMNPPFHAGRAAEPAIGQNMIRAAHRALRPGGKLRLVANRQLPYEKTLKDVFGGFQEIVVADGFKVLQA